jgi:hypothetical protein
MFEYHGWVTIRDSAGCEEREEDPAPKTLDLIDQPSKRRACSAPADLKRRNGAWFLTLAGLNNHRNSGIVELFERVAHVAPGSYETLKRGQVARHDDTHFSPHFGVVEDDCSNSE